ncbi:uncharacterized protein LOC129884242 [Solanum dulcamara]|uniref:uncharacterized protein LOC129884242 n=1 Tax=Solanum dulcamara TaxID=45834 RepID=UPI002485AD7C|nr:uncharacterized protein LOC129884242 [Solanum dulcamara]
MGLVDWKEFKGAFFDHFFPLVLRESKVQEFINLRKGTMSVREYTLRFTKFLKYAPFIVADHRARMSKFILGVSDLVLKECRTTILIKEMNMPTLMTHAKQIKKEKLKKRSRGESNRARTDGEKFSHGKSSNDGLPQFLQKYICKNSFNTLAPKFSKDRVSNPNPQGDALSGQPISPCKKCDKKHIGKCLTRSGACFGYGNMGHQVKD